MSSSSLSKVQLDESQIQNYVQEFREGEKHDAANKLEKSVEAFKAAKQAAANLKSAKDKLETWKSLDNDFKAHEESWFFPTRLAVSLARSTVIDWHLSYHNKTVDAASQEELSLCREFEQAQNSSSRAIDLAGREYRLRQAADITLSTVAITGLWTGAIATSVVTGGIGAVPCIGAAAAGTKELLNNRRVIRGQMQPLPSAKEVSKLFRPDK